MGKVLDAAKTLKDCGKMLEAIDVLSVLAPNAFHGDGTKLSLWKEIKSDMVIWISNEAKIAASLASAETDADLQQTEIPFEKTDRDEKDIKAQQILEKCGAMDI
jgi:hypothetical protein